ncbi:MAG: PqqD family protein [bacterium]|nr:hypothetical protein [Lachnospiraceae bacterium]
MYKLNEEKMFFDIADGQAVVINFTTGMYYGTSTLGSAILENLVKGASEGSIVDALKAADGCPENMDTKLKGFIADLVEKEILVYKEGSGSPAQFTAEAFSEGFDFTVDEFAEVQDLLMADPIHEVDVEQGWPILRDDV